MTAALEASAEDRQPLVRQAVYNSEFRLRTVVLLGPGSLTSGEGSWNTDEKRTEDR